MNPHPHPFAHLAGMMNLAPFQHPSINAMSLIDQMSMILGLTPGFGLGNISNCSTPSRSSSTSSPPSSSSGGSSNPLAYLAAGNLAPPSMDLINQTMPFLSGTLPYLGNSPTFALGNVSDLSAPSPRSSSHSSCASSSTSSPTSSSASFSSSSDARSSASTSTVRNQASSIPRSAPGPVRNSRNRVEYCNVCQKDITAEGKRSQGPRRHVLQFHLNRPLFFCPYTGCKNRSRYDKSHVSNHIRRMHKEIPAREPVPAEKHTYEEEEDRWFKLCFGIGSEKPSNEVVPKAMVDDVNENTTEAPSTPAKAVKVEVADDVKENTVDGSSISADPLAFGQTQTTQKTQMTLTEAEVKKEIEDEDFAQSKLYYEIVPKIEVEEVKKEIDEEPSPPTHPVTLKSETDAVVKEEVVKEEVVEEPCSPANPVASLRFSIDRILNQ